MVKRTRSESREKNKKAKRKKHRSLRRDRRRSSEDSRPRRSTKSESKQNREYPSSKRSPHSRERTREGSPYRQRYKDGRSRNDYQSNERKLTMSRPLNYGRYELNDGRSSSDRTRTSLEVEIDRMLTTEKHHTQHVGHRSSGEINDVIWCPRYIRPDIKQHVRGGGSLLHHRCRSCRQLCYHLLGQPGTKRLCLECSGWKRKYIPEWYFHKRCKYCY